MKSIHLSRLLNGQDFGHVIIKGRNGAGKTRFCRRLSEKWLGCSGDILNMKPSELHAVLCGAPGGADVRKWLDQRVNAGKVRGDIAEAVAANFGSLSADLDEEARQAADRAKELKREWEIKFAALTHQRQNFSKDYDGTNPKRGTTKPQLAPGMLSIIPGTLERCGKCGMLRGQEEPHPAGADGQPVDRVFDLQQTHVNALMWLEHAECAGPRGVRAMMLNEQLQKVGKWISQWLKELRWTVTAWANPAPVQGETGWDVMVWDGKRFQKRKRHGASAGELWRARMLAWLGLAATVPERVGGVVMDECEVLDKGDGLKGVISPLAEVMSSPNAPRNMVMTVVDSVVIGEGDVAHVANTPLKDFTVAGGGSSETVVLFDLQPAEEETEDQQLNLFASHRAGATAG